MVVSNARKNSSEASNILESKGRFAIYIYNLRYQDMFGNAPRKGKEEQDRSRSATLGLGAALSLGLGAALSLGLGAALSLGVG